MFSQSAAGCPEPVPWLFAAKMVSQIQVGPLDEGARRLSRPHSCQANSFAYVI